MDIDEIKSEMVEHRQFDIASGNTRYRWDLGIHGVADQFKPAMGDEVEWAGKARTRAATMIGRPIERASIA